MTSHSKTLKVEAISKRYGSRTVINSISLDLRPGEITALVGPSGAGKTTLMRLIAGMEKLDRGVIRAGATILSNDTTHQPIEQRNIGLVFQDFALFPHLSVAGNIMFGLHAKSRAEQQSITQSWIERMRLEDRRDALPHQLSGGEQQRVAIARAMAPEPHALLMDEPFSGLDPELRHSTRQTALSVIREAGIPALFVTHDHTEALRHADQIAVLNAGTIAQSGPPDDLYMLPNSLNVARALGEIQSIDARLLPDTLKAELPDGPELFLRPEALQLNPNGAYEFKVLASKRAGTLCELTLAVGNTELICTSILDQLPPLNGTVRVSINSRYVFSWCGSDL